jgi:hypothetical protein
VLQQKESQDLQKQLRVNKRWLYQGTDETVQERSLESLPRPGTCVEMVMSRLHEVAEKN